MSDSWARILGLIAERKVRISDHGYDELAQDGILANEVVEGAAAAEALEDYPEYPKGPCVLVLQRTTSGDPIHVVWGIPKGKTEPTVMVTAYRPAPERWSTDFRRRIR